MQLSISDLSYFHGPYAPDFMATVALQAYAKRPEQSAIARQYCLPEHLVEAWCNHLASTAHQLFSIPQLSTSPQARMFDHRAAGRGIAALEMLDVCIAVLEGKELRYQFANEAYLRLASSPDVIGRRMREVFPISMSDGIEAGVLNVLLTGHAWEVSNYQANLPELGETIWEGKIIRLPLEKGREPAVAIWIRDVTFSKRVETSLRQQIALLHAISENSTDVMFAKDLNGRLQFANPAALQLLGKPLADVIGKTDAELLLDKEAARLVTENDQRIMEKGEAEEVEEPVPLPDGSHRVWLSQKRPYFDETGRLIGLLGVSRDITHRKSAEMSMHAAHDALQRVLDSITDGLAVLNREWRYTYFSDTGAKMLGLRSNDLIGKNFWELFPHAENLTFGREYRRAMESGCVTHFEEYYPEPLNRWVECHCYPSADGLSVYFRDVTDRRNAQNAADTNERRINALLEATPIGLAYADANGRILVINSEGKRIWGNPPAADSSAQYVEWKGWWADDSERHGQAIQAHEWPTARALQGEQVLDTVLEIEPFDTPGLRRLVLHRSVPIKSDEGAVVGAVTAMTDITESVQTKRAVVEGNHRIRQLANTIPQLAWMADREGAVHWFNDRWFDYTGLDANEMEGWAWGVVHHPDVLPDVLERWKESLESGTAFEMTFPIKGSDGVFRPFYTLAEPLKNFDGTVVQWFGTCTDVSALQRIQEDLTKTQQWLQEGLVTGKMVAWEWDFKSDEIRYSNNALAVLGYGEGKASVALKSVHPEDLSLYNSTIDRAIKERRALDQVTRRIRPDNGETIWVRVKGNALVGGPDEFSGMRGILTDVTEQVLREQALEDASDRKDEFLAMLAHELRNPLAPIATAAQLLTMIGNDPQRVRNSSEIIGRQVKHMTRLIDDLLDVSRVTRGLVELDMAPVQMKDIVNNAIEQARPLIEARHHELALRVDSNPAVVMGDRIRLCQILVNLLTNAAKYTPQGGKILLDIRVVKGDVEIAIEDNGIGIDSKLLPNVFDLFTQATRTPDRTQGGLGLGLALVDSLVKMHRGRVGAFSEGLGKGSRFVVTLPNVAESGHNPEESTVTEGEITLGDTHTSRLSVLVVDDNVDAADMLAAVLRVQGHDVTIKYSSIAALVAARQTPCRLYILDIGLPDLDGYALVRELRAMPTNKQATFVALTGYGQAHDKVLARSAGFDHHLVKPVDIAHLGTIIRSIEPS